jgi:capsular polysaccharide biosynthesis protein
VTPIRRLSNRLSGAVRRLRGKPPRAVQPRSGLKLEITTELSSLTHVESIVDSFAHAHIQCAVASFTLGGYLTETEMKAWMAGRTAGEDCPSWHDGTGGSLVHGVLVGRIREAFYTPDFGAVIDQSGQVMKSTVGEALFVTPSLAALPYVTLVDDKPFLTPPADPPRVESGGVFMAWGGRFNYGHFLLDCLPSLAVLQLTGLLNEMPPVAPPLTTWQREGVELLLGAEGASRLVEVSAPLVSVGDIAFATPMDHFLHAPNKPLDWVREQMLARIDPAPTGVSRLYISRRGDPKRLMINEAELEAALEARGFKVVRPETLSVARQIALFRDADIIVAPTGAALANILFCKPTAKIFEIQPTNFVGIWTRGVAHFIGAAWHGFFAPSPIQERDIVIEGSLRPGIEFQWRTPLEPFLAFLDARID